MVLRPGFGRHIKQTTLALINGDLHIQNRSVSNMRFPVLSTAFLGITTATILPLCLFPETETASEASSLAIQNRLANQIPSSATKNLVPFSHKSTKPL